VSAGYVKEFQGEFSYLQKSKLAKTMFLKDFVGVSKFSKKDQRV
jgi:hypothetical protein